MADPQQGLGQQITPAPGLPFYGNAVPPAANPLPALSAQPPVPAPHILPAQVPITQPPPPTATLNGHPDDLGILPGK